MSHSNAESLPSCTLDLSPVSWDKVIKGAVVSSWSMVKSSSLLSASFQPLMRQQAALERTVGRAATDIFLRPVQLI